MNERQAAIDAAFANIYLDGHFRAGMVPREVREAYVAHWVEFMQYDLGPRASSTRAILATRRGLDAPFCWWWTAFILNHAILPLLTRWWKEK